MDEVKFSKLDDWWSSLTVDQKNRIASKANKRLIVYPESSKWWISVDDCEKEKIHNHCVDKHGYILPEYNEGNIMSY